MTRLHLVPLPGTDLAQLEQWLSEHLLVLPNVLNGLNADRQRDNYLRWVNDCVTQMRGRLASQDVNRLYLTRTHWAIRDSPHAPDLLMLINREVAERKGALQRAVDELRRQAYFWSQTGRLIAPDTCFFCEHPQKFDGIDDYSHTFEDVGVHFTLVIPLVVVDELDGLKRHSKAHTRWRASYTLAVLDRINARPGTLAMLQDRGDPRMSAEPAPKITVAVVGDDPAHVRLPINDDEIVDRAAAVATVSGKPMRLITYDTNMRMRCQMNDVDVRKLRKNSDVHDRLEPAE